MLCRGAGRDDRGVDTSLPVLWLCGPPGVGKSTIAWKLFEGLPEGAAYVDIDQLGMCYPALPSDPGRTELEGRILGDVAANVRAAGATCLVVSGYIDASSGIHAHYLRQCDLRVVRLRADKAELRRRLAGRGRVEEPTSFVEGALDHADELDAGTLNYPVLDTTQLSIAQALETVREGWPVLGRSVEGTWAPPTHAPGEAVWLCGPPAVGKSIVGWTVYQRSLADGWTTAFVDLAQLGFMHGAGPRLTASNVASAWAHFASYGAQRLVIVGNVTDQGTLDLYRSLLPEVVLTVHRLHADPVDLRDRIARQGRGETAQLAGDALRGQPHAVLEQAWRESVATAERLEQLRLGDVRIDTTRLTAAEVAAQVSRLATA